MRTSQRFEFTNALTFVTLLLAFSAANVQAAPPTGYYGGLSLVGYNHRLFVAAIEPGVSAKLGLRVGDQVNAVNNRKVSNETAFLNRLAMPQSPVIVVSRLGVTQTLNAPTGGFGGWMDPTQMLQTSQGVMHRAAAARLGLSGTPISGTAEPRQ